MMYNRSMKPPRQLERMVKGFSNHRRIEILSLLERRTELSLSEIADTLGINFKTASEHSRRLAAAGLVMKRYEGRMVRHAPSPRGRNVLKFLRILE